MDAFSSHPISSNTHCISKNPIHDINSDELKKLIARRVTVIDVRIPYEWEDTGLIQNSIPILFFDEKGRAQEELWIKQASNFINPKKDVALVCKTGRRSRVVAECLALHHGYKNIYNHKGGIQSWIAEGNKTITWTQHVA